MVTTRRKRAKPSDPFDTSNVSSPQSEKACLAALLDLLDRDTAAAREIADTLTADMWTVDCAEDVFLAIVEALRLDKPGVGDFGLAIRRRADELGVEPADAIHLATDLANYRAATGYQAKRQAAAAAAEVREEYQRRRGILAAADIVHRLHDRSVSPEDMRDAAARAAGVADLIEQRKPRTRRLRVRKASEIDAKPIEWFWPQRISSGSLTIITGMPGLSKSLLTIDIAARITTGGKWPDGTGSAPKGGVMLFGTEDDPEKVVIPRLIAAGADRELVRIVDGAEDGRSEWLSTVSIERDMDLLREQLEEFPECRAIVFDPLSQFIDADENSNADTRAALAPLVELAQERNLAVIAVMHLNKKTDSMMIQRIAGAGSYGQVARHILFVGSDPDDTATGVDRRRAMIVAKNSYGPMNVGQLYRVITRAGDQPAIEWIAGSVEMEAERLNPKPPGVTSEYREKRSEAVDALRELLAPGELRSADVFAAMEGQGFKRRQIDHAAHALGVKKSPVAGDGGRRQGWIWSLPTTAAAGRPTAVGSFSLDEWPPIAT